MILNNTLNLIQEIIIKDSKKIKALTLLASTGLLGYGLTDDHHPGAIVLGGLSLAKAAMWKPKKDV